MDYHLVHTRVSTSLPEGLFTLQPRNVISLLINNSSLFYPVLSLGSQDSQTMTSSACSAPWKSRQQLRPALPKCSTPSIAKDCPSPCFEPKVLKGVGCTFKINPEQSQTQILSKDTLAPVLAKMPHGLQWTWRLRDWCGYSVPSDVSLALVCDSQTPTDLLKKASCKSQVWENNIAEKQHFFFFLSHI